MHSMTGYGRGVAQLDGRTLTVELKSVNHRFLDISLRMPRTFLALEDFARKKIGERLSRGHVDAFVTYKNQRADSKAVTVDEPLFNAYLSAMEKADKTGLLDDRSLMGVLRFPDVLTVSEADEDVTALSRLMDAAFDQALLALTQMRKSEGERMRNDLSMHLDLLEGIVFSIEKRYLQTVAEYANRLKNAVSELVGASVDETRLITEVAIMADRAAIDEEISRLKSHILSMRGYLASDEPVGRKLDFIVQELNREVNTITSKSQDVVITQLAVDGKAEIEKLREQLQNVE